MQSVPSFLTTSPTILSLAHITPFMLASLFLEHNQYFLNSRPLPLLFLHPKTLFHQIVTWCTQTGFSLPYTLPLQSLVILSNILMKFNHCKPMAHYEHSRFKSLISLTSLLPVNPGWHLLFLMLIMLVLNNPLQSCINVWHQVHQVHMSPFPPVLPLISWDICLSTVLCSASINHYFSKIKHLWYWDLNRKLFFPL